MVSPNADSVAPFLKWAGGKRWFARGHPGVLALSDSERLVEPFVGSGAVFFELAPRRALLNDANAELIETYSAIREDWKAVLTLLKRHSNHHCTSYYYEVRARRPLSKFARAARFIYLNRTCFNGLFRVNRNGDFNVPKGTKDSVLLETDDFAGVANALRRATLRVGDFAKTVGETGHGDVIFADPPYTVRHNHNGFIKYNEKLFSWADQERLRDSLVAAAARGARVVVSNADHPSIHDLYAGFEICRLSRSSVMASESHRRRETTELIIVIR